MSIGIPSRLDSDIWNGFWGYVAGTQNASHGALPGIRDAIQAGAQGNPLAQANGTTNAPQALQNAARDNLGLIVVVVVALLVLTGKSR